MGYQYGHGYGLELRRGGATATGALAELNGYSDGFAFIAANGGGVGEVAVRDTGTSANNLSNVAASELFTNSGTSPKLVLQPDGAYAWTKHNFARNTEDFTTGWTAQDGTAIEGTTEVRELADTGLHYVQHNISDAIAGRTYRQAVELKKGDGTSAPDIVQLVFRSDRFGANTWQNVDLSDGTLGTSGSANIDQGIEDIGDGWYRVYVVALCTGGGSNSQYVAFTNDDDGLGRVPSYAGDAAANVFARKWQFHYGADALDYMAAGSSAVVDLAFEWDGSFGGAGAWRLLSEKASTNLLQSSAFDLSYWLNVPGTTWTENYAVAPNGSQEALRFAPEFVTDPGASASTHRMYASIGPTTAGELTTRSVYMYPIETISEYVGNPDGADVALDLLMALRADTNDTLYVDLENKDFETVGTNVTNKTFDIVGDTGWYLISATLEALSTDSTDNQFFSFSNRVFQPTFDPYPSGEEEVYLWGAQAERGAARTSLIPTNGTSATRGADATNFTLTSINWGSSGTLFWKGTTPRAGEDAVLWSADDGTANERIRLVYDSGNVRFVITDGGTEVANIDLGAKDAETTTQVTATWAANDVAVSIDGGAVQTDTDTSGGLPTVTTLRCGYSPAGEQGVVFTDNIVHVPIRVSDSDLPTWKYKP